MLSVNETQILLKSVQEQNLLAVLAPDGDILQKNEVFDTLLEYTDVEIKNMSFEDIFTDNLAKTSFKKALRGVQGSTEALLKTANDKETLFERTFTPVLDTDSKVEKIIVLGKDQTQRYQAELNNLKYLEALHNSQAIIEFDTAGNILTANKNFLSTMGYNLDEIKQKHHSLFCDVSLVQSKEYTEFWNSLKEGKSVSAIFPRKAKYDRQVWIRAAYNPIKDDSGAVVKIVKFAYDITEDISQKLEMQRKTVHLQNQVAELIKKVDASILQASSAESSTDKLQSLILQESAHIENTKSNMQSIADNSTQIQKMVSLVNEVALQTTVLSFNAALEASRAGEAGRGFSIVAEEVRKLAEKIQASAQEMSKVITSECALVEQSKELSGNSSNAIAQIGNSIKEVVTILGELHSTGRSQKEVISATLQAINDLKQLQAT